MGLITSVLGRRGAAAEIGNAAAGLAEVFVPNATRAMTLDHAALAAALGQHGLEFQLAPLGWFDRFVNALNRLPRPALALGTIGLFIYAMTDPEHFAARMQGLAAVPEPLWWLLGAVVSFYFGARELFYQRGGRITPMSAPPAAAPRAENPALAEWRSAGEGRNIPGR